MAKFNIMFFALYLSLVIGGGISCKNNEPNAIKLTDSTQKVISADTIIDPIPSPGCDILLSQKGISIFPQKNFPKKSRGNAVVNVVISKDGKLDSWVLVYLRIVKDEKEIYLFDQTTRNDSKYPKEIEFICDSLNEELQRAIITCKRGNNNETRLRIPIKIKLE